MRILAFSDLHRNHRAAMRIVAAAGEADVVVGAGDFATHGVGVADTIDILKAIERPVILVPGNHESLEDLAAACRDWPHAHILHGGGRVIDGVPFFGVGYEAPRSSLDAWNMALSEEGAAHMLHDCGVGGVLVTHAPPYGVADVQRDGSHAGARAFRRLLEKRPQRLHLCGHIHHAWGMVGQVRSCLVQNLGPWPNWFEI